MVLYTVFLWISHFYSLTYNSQCSPNLRIMAKTALNSLKKYCFIYFSHDLYFFALFLDPSLKNEIPKLLKENLALKDVKFLLKY